MRGGAHHVLGRDRLVALVAAVIAVVAFAGTFRFDDVPASLMEGMGAAEFPRLACGIIFAFAVMLFIAGSGGEEEPLPPVQPCTWWTLLACLAFFGVLALIGMLPAMILFQVIAGWIWGEHRWPVLLISAAGTALVIWVLFVRIFQFTLPGGLLGNALFG